MQNLTRLTDRRARQIVLLVAVGVFVPKLLIAMRTFGTEDIRTWTGFAQGVRQKGPVGVYAIDFSRTQNTLYNHPPLVGYYLALINEVSQWGVPLRVTLRAVSSAADVVSALLVFEILRARVSLRRALASAVGVAASPLLVMISGYHGNTDPLFLMLVLLGSYLVIDRDRPLSGGAVLALSIGIKLVPVVVLPTLAVYLVRHRRDLLLRAAAGFATAFALTWGWAILRQSASLRHNVLGYAGINDRPWGLVHFADELGWTGTAQFLVGPGKTLVVIVCALVPAALAWRRKSSAMASVALSLVTFLALTPAFGVQYLAWGVAAAYLLDVWSATVFNLLGGLVLFQIYDRWNGGLPWRRIALGRPFTSAEIALAALVWAALVTVVVRGARTAYLGDGINHVVRRGDEGRSSPKHPTMTGVTVFASLQPPGKSGERDE